VSQYGYAAGARLKESGSYTGDNSAERVFERKAAERAMGNRVALNVKGGGPGTGRTVYRSGYQAMHGAAVQGSTPAPRDILSEFGPDKR
jgi:hypothetical protein